MVKGFKVVIPLDWYIRTQNLKRGVLALKKVLQLKG